MLRKWKFLDPFASWMCAIKLLPKFWTIRLASCITKVISDKQFWFIKGRCILDCVVALHEIIHEVKKKQDGIILKVDFEKAYDKVNWNFLYKMLKNKGFSDKWDCRVMRMIRGGKVAIRTNDVIGPFPIHKWIRQGNPFFPSSSTLLLMVLRIWLKKSRK